MLRGQVTEREVFCVERGKFGLGKKISFQEGERIYKVKVQKETEVSLELEILELIHFPLGSRRTRYIIIAT